MRWRQTGCRRRSEAWAAFWEAGQSACGEGHVEHEEPADGALGAHLNAVQEAYFDFAHLAQRIESRVPQHPRAA